VYDRMDGVCDRIDGVCDLTGGGGAGVCDRVGEDIAGVDGREDMEADLTWTELNRDRGDCADGL
jgi:hypothetical protein